jgi:hypothetical protein
MGMGPIQLAPSRIAAREADQYQQMFNQSANAPIPTWNGGPMPVRSPGSVPSGWHPNQDASRAMMGGVVSQYMNNNLTPEQWQTLLPVGMQGGTPQTAPQPFVSAGPYGGQAAQLAGLLPVQPQNAPGPYPMGLLGGKGPFRPGGK